MSEPTEGQELPKQRHTNEYEDPHYHDEDEHPSGDDSRPRPRPTNADRPRRKTLPPPRRRFEQD